jgi:hypothetical protein
MDQAVEHLPSKHEAQSSNPSITKKPTRQKECKTLAITKLN